jgi:hypothetical protein
MTPRVASGTDVTDGTPQLPLQWGRRMTKAEQKAYKALYDAVSKIAANNEHPLAPAHYLAIQRQWRQIVLTARKAKEKADAALPSGEQR